MNRSIELPESHFARLAKAAAEDGVTPAEWIAGRLPPPSAHPFPNGQPTRSLAERFAGRVGVIASGGEDRLSERAGEAFGEMLAEQRNAGRL